MENFSKEAYIRAIMALDCSVNGNISQQEKDKYIDAHIINLSINTPIYRIFKIERLISILEDKKLCLVKPKMWDDPFENFLLNATGVLEDGTEVSFKPMREQYYGQCWSLKKECDGLWRNYTSNLCVKCTENDFNQRYGKYSVSVKVKTTVGKLMNAFYDENNPFHSLCYFIGRVHYCDMEEIVECLKSANILDNTNVNQILSLLKKRSSFSYEEEVRLIFCRPEKVIKDVKNLWDPCSDIFEFQIEPDVLFDEIEFDPWIDKKTYDKYKEQLGRYYSGSIIQSKLYEHPFFEIQF